MHCKWTAGHGNEHTHTRPWRKDLVGKLSRVLVSAGIKIPAETRERGEKINSYHTLTNIDS